MKMIGIVEIDGQPVFYEELDRRVQREAEQTGTLAYALLRFVERYLDPKTTAADLVGRLGPSRAWLELRGEQKRVRFIVEASLCREELRQRLEAIVRGSKDGREARQLCLFTLLREGEDPAPWLDEIENMINQWRAS
mgnify:CR=1 FL=1